MLSEMFSFFRGGTSDAASGQPDAPITASRTYTAVLCCTMQDGVARIKPHMVVAGVGIEPMIVMPRFNVDPEILYDWGCTGEHARALADALLVDAAIYNAPSLDDPILVAFVRDILAETPHHDPPEMVDGSHFHLQCWYMTSAHIALWMRELRQKAAGYRAAEQTV